MSGHGAEDIAKHVRTYIAVFVSLMVLTVVTVAISSMDHSIAVGVALAMFIAAIKGSLVACFFMHLISEKKIIFYVMGLTVFFFVVIMLLPVTEIESGFHAANL